jgi:predicted transcriptional regulator
MSAAQQESGRFRSGSAGSPQDEDILYKPVASCQLAGDLRLIDAVGGREAVELNEYVGQCQCDNANNRQRDADQSRKIPLFD